MEARLSHFKRKRITDETPFHSLDQQKNMFFFPFIPEVVFSQHTIFTQTQQGKIPTLQLGFVFKHEMFWNDLVFCYIFVAMLGKPKSMKRVISAFSVNSVMPCKSAIIIHLLKIILYCLILQICLIVLKICKDWNSKCKLFRAHDCKSLQLQMTLGHVQILSFDDAFCHTSVAPWKWQMRKIKWLLHFFLPLYCLLPSQKVCWWRMSLLLEYFYINL